MLSQSVPLVSGCAFVLICGVLIFRQPEELAGPKTQYAVGRENPGQFCDTLSIAAQCHKQTGQLYDVGFN